MNNLSSSLSVAALALLFLGGLGTWTACNGPEEGLRRADPSAGPQVRFDPQRLPFPDAPYPSDYFTRPDGNSPTGLRVDLPGPRQGYGEARVRDALSQDFGFGVFSPITVAFDKPLDVDILIDRHQQKVPDFSDDAIYLVNIDRDSPEFGSFELLDMGIGNFPVTLERPDRYYANDTRSDGTNLLFPTAPHHGGEPNLRRPDSDPYEPGELLTFYERQTNTLILRSVDPLAPATTYAVVLTSAVRGEDFRAIDSPFDWINDPTQTAALEPLREILPEAYPERFDAGLANIRYTWSFTTGEPTNFIEEVRAGLYGQGPMAELSDAFPPRLQAIHDVRGTGEKPLNFELDDVIDVVMPIAAQELGDDGAEVLEDAFRAIDYVVSGTFFSPNFLGRDDGLAAGDAAFDDQAIELQASWGPVKAQPFEVPFICVVSETDVAGDRPFPVIIYSHAISSTRLELMGFAGTMAKFGFATCTVESPGHGIEIPSEYETIVRNIASSQDLNHLVDVLDIMRARDLNNDGERQAGGDYFTSDLLRTRRTMRQTTIDQMQLIRILRSFDGERQFGAEPRNPTFETVHPELAAGWDQDEDGDAELAGDFSATGTVDFGGERPYATWGTSLGAIQSTILAGAEPTVVVGASNAGGGGLVDLAARSSIGNARASVILRMMGPALIGNPTFSDGQELTRLQWLLPTTTGSRTVFVADVPKLEEGTEVVLRNLAREQLPELHPEHSQDEAVVTDGIFRVGIAADGYSPAARRVDRGFDPSLDLVKDIMACRETRECADTTCPDEHYCSHAGQCRPLAGCRDEFDADELPPELAPEYTARVIDDPTEYGDPLAIEIYDSDGGLLHSFDEFSADVIDQNMLYPAGAPLAALSDGFGLERQTPEFRQFIGLGQTLLEPVDPAVWASHFARRPRTYDYEESSFQSGKTNFLAIGTLGDQTVPISAGITLARAAGALETHAPHPDYGVPENQMLIDNFVYEGIADLNRFEGYPDTLFDPDNLDGGLWRPDGQEDLDDPKPVADPSLRATWETDGGIQALRLGYLSRDGEHTFNIPDPTRPFDIHAFLTNQVGWFLANAGVLISDDHCLEELSMENCSFFRPGGFENPL